MGNVQVLHILVTFILLCNFQTQCQSQLNRSSAATSKPRGPHGHHHLLCHPEQSRALLQFMSHFEITSSASSCELSYSRTGTWNESRDCCSSWDGVTCNAVTGQVIGLDLSCNMLRPRPFSLRRYGIFSSLFTSIPNLQMLNLAYNDFLDMNMSSLSLGLASLPPSLTHLNLSDSSFSGYVPFEISHLSRLVSLDLSSNYDLRFESATVLKSMVQNLTQLRALNLEASSLLAFPDSASCLVNLSSSLTSLHLVDSGLEGTFPESFLLLPNLVELYLSGNTKLSGSLPKLSNSTSLRVLQLSRTNLSGELPADSIGNLKSLQVLDLRSSKFSGSIPASLGNLPQITEIYLNGLRFSMGQLVSYIEDNHFSGPIPSSLGNLTQITRLDLSHNHLSGAIPSSLGHLTQLPELDLSYNHLSGAVPSSLGNLSQITRLDLSQNHLSGAIPSSLGYLSQLRELDLSQNHLSGAIPSSLGYLTQLSYLHLGWNTLTGLIPNVILNLTQLYSMDLSSNQLEGSLPTSVGHPFPNLSLLDWSNNSLSGPLPSWLFALPSVRDIQLYNNHLFGPLCELISPLLSSLNLSNNELIGEIPKPICRSVNFMVLDLSQNHLTGSVGELPEVYYLDLSSNLLEGSLPVPSPGTYHFLVSNNSFTGEVPSLICNASLLVVLDLSFNYLSGMIPQCLGNLSDSLVVLNLCMNNFHGTIPDTFAKGSELTYLNLNGNQLGGGLPRSLTNCEMLEALDLDNNFIGDVFPRWMQNLQRLQVLVLKSNKFYGCVDIDLSMNSSFPMLRILDLSNNNFNGPLPTRLVKSLTGMIQVSEDQGQPEYMETNGLLMRERYGYRDSVTVTLKGVEMTLIKILTIFTAIDMSNNKFDGNIPLEFGSLHALKGLNLSHNYLAGPIPPTFGKLVNLEWLDLSSNKLVGRIPTQLLDLNYLEVLNFSHNRLHGPIPTGKQFNTFKDESYAGNSGLCGFPLPKCGADNSNRPTQTASSDESNSPFSWKSSYVGYGCGTIFGIAIGYLVFSTGSPQWFVKMVDGGRQTKGRKLRGRGTIN